MRRSTRFVLRSVLAGILLAAALVTFFPDWLQSGRTLDLAQSPAPPSADSPAPLGIPVPPLNPPESSHRSDPGTLIAPHSYAEGVARAAPAVVNIMTTRSPEPARTHDPDSWWFFGDAPYTPTEREHASLGSGVIMTAAGHILTNHHVIDGADAIAVILANGTAHPAEIIGLDPDTDLAVLRIHAGNLQVARMGVSSQLRVGDVVLAIGNPFGMGQTVTQGIVSATGRTELGINVFEDFIQTDAAINPGNSGGALINARGEVVGINTAIFSRSGGSHGIGFAIPVDLAREVMNEIIATGLVARGWLGIEVRTLDAHLARNLDLSATEGVLIAGVLRGGPAAEAGLSPGDIVVALEGKTVRSAREALYIIARKRPGESIQADILRGETPLQIEARAGQRPV